MGDPRGPLAGVRALDLGTILAGPYAGTLLAGLGADVVKVEAPAGDAFREPGFVYNRGMRGLAIDLSRPAGQQAFHRLVETADVVIDNSRLGVSKRLRVDYATLAEVNPRVITLSVAGFGEHGPYAHKPAFDPVLQAMSGMMTAQGGDGDPGFYTIPVNDVVAAVTAVLAVCLGLYHRGQSGEGQRTWTSLVASSLTMQSGELVRYEGRPPAQRGGRDFVGPSPADRFYQTADGWLRVQAPGLAAVGEALGLARPHLRRSRRRRGRAGRAAADDRPGTADGRRHPGRAGPPHDRGRLRSGHRRRRSAGGAPLPVRAAVPDTAAATPGSAAPSRPRSPMRRALASTAARCSPRPA